MTSPARATPVGLTDEVLQAWPLPQPGETGGKESRGRILIIAGSAEVPGAARLAGEAALRAGAGKLAIATVASAAMQLAIAVPEARVIALPETARGGIAPPGFEALQEAAAKAQAIVIGPGMQDEEATCGLVRMLLRGGMDAHLVLDACAMNALRDDAAARASVCITPHAGEMAHLTKRDKADIQADPDSVAHEAARRFHALVVLKGAVTHIAATDGRSWRHEGGNAGLGVSGSGDVLAGLIGGLAARGASLEQAAAFAVRVHARAGERLAARLGSLGYLARELSVEVPALLDALAPRAQRRIGFG